MRAVAWISALCILWMFVLGNTWAAIGFAEGVGYLTAVVEKQGLDLFYPARDYAMVLVQLPLAVAIRLGVTDLHLLARLLTLGTLGLPALLYSYALARARHDALVLAAVIAVMSVAYMTTSYFTIGEYNTAYAIAVVMTTVVVTRTQLGYRDAALLLALAVLGLRTYEVFAYLGPALGLLLLAAWQRGRPPATWRTPRNVGRFVGLVALASVPRSLIRSWRRPACC